MTVRERNGRLEDADLGSVTAHDELANDGKQLRRGQHTKIAVEHEPEVSNQKSPKMPQKPLSTTVNITSQTGRKRISTAAKTASTRARELDCPGQRSHLP